MWVILFGIPELGEHGRWITDMVCEVFIPQIQIQSGQWIEVGIPTNTFVEAEQQREQFPLSNKMIAFRIIRSSCLERKIKHHCCGGG